jgi:hypothetical protein
MSGFPALRCFIFFAADLFILDLRPSVGKPRIVGSEIHPYTWKAA